MFYLSEYKSPAGIYSIICTENALKGIWLKDQKYYLRGFEKSPIENYPCEYSKRVHEWLQLYFDGKKPEINLLNIQPEGTDFQHIIYRELMNIPYGETTTYGKIAENVAKKLGLKSMSAQAVGGAVGRNPVSVIIPCHRVVGADGSFTGYAGGIEVKRFLLELEGVRL